VLLCQDTVRLADAKFEIAVHFSFHFAVLLSHAGELVSDQPILGDKLVANRHDYLGEERGGDNERRLYEADMRGVTGGAWRTGNDVGGGRLRASEMGRVHCALVEGAVAELEQI